MPIAHADLESALTAAFPEGDVTVTDLAGDGDHYRARIVSSQFNGLSRVRQHQLVYSALAGRVGGEIHALAIETSAPSTTDASRAV